MNTAALVIAAVAIIGMFGFVIARMNKLQGAPVDESAKEKIGELSEKLRAAESKRDELSGKNKELFAAHAKLDAENKSLGREVAQYEATEKKRDEQFNLRLQQLEAAKKALEEERMRVQREDEERLRMEEEERDRIWNDHEVNVIAQLRELCKRPEYHFTCYDNADLPAGFDGSLKPDFLIEFLGQYVIFDAKVSKAKNLQTYIGDAVKKTADKIKENDKIAKFLYLVVPSSAIAELKGRYRYANGDHTIYVVSPESLAPILAALKRITSYEIADKLDPKQRENIVNLIAKFDWHVSFRNALDITLAKQGAELVGDIRGLSPDLVDDILDRKDKLPITLPNKIDIKRLLHPDSRRQEISDIESPKPKILKKAAEAAKALFE